MQPADAYRQRILAARPLEVPFRTAMRPYLTTEHSQRHSYSQSQRLCDAASFRIRWRNKSQLRFGCDQHRCDLSLVLNHGRSRMPC